MSVYESQRSVKMGHAVFEMGSPHVFPEYRLPFTVYVGMNWIPAALFAEISASMSELAPDVAAKPPLFAMQSFTAVTSTVVRPAAASCVATHCAPNESRQLV